MGTVPHLNSKIWSCVWSVIQDKGWEVPILRAQPHIEPVAICTLISAALTKSTRSTRARGCLRTIMHDNIKAFLYCLPSSFPPSSASPNCYLELKASGTTANIIFWFSANAENPSQWFQPQSVAESEEGFCPFTGAILTIDPASR